LYQTFCHLMTKHADLANVLTIRTRYGPWFNCNGHSIP